MPPVTIPLHLTYHEALTILAAQTGYTPAELSQMNRHTLHTVLRDGGLDRTEAGQTLLGELLRAEAKAATQFQPNDPRNIRPL